MAVAVDDITPTVAQIASHLRSRTRDDLGNELGTFTDATRPTGAEVAEHAQRSARHVALRLGTPGSRWGGDLLAEARDAAAVHAARSIELSYYNDGSSVDDAGLIELGRMWSEQIEALVTTARNNQPGGSRITSIEQVPGERDDPLAPVALLPEQIVNGPDPDETP